MSKILIQRTIGGGGDILMLTPTIRTLSKLNNEVHIMTDRRYLNGMLVKLLKNNPYIKRIIDISTDKVDTFLSLEKDKVFNFDHCPCYSYEMNPSNPIKNRIDIFADSIGLTLDSKKTDLFLTEEEDSFAGNFTSNNYLLLAPQASTMRRNIPAGIFRGITDYLLSEGILTIIVKHDACEKRSIVQDSLVTAYNLDVLEIASLVKHSKYVVCSDSAVLHIAGALEVPSLSFWGPTPPESRINYYKKADYYYPGKSLKCSPCFYKECSIAEKCNRMGAINEFISLLKGKLNELNWQRTEDPL
jgi:ADP-heptose:LPS heptosyltransferase